MFRSSFAVLGRVLVLVLWIGSDAFDTAFTTWVFPLLGLLFLRGPQTLSELLTRSNRLFQFDDVAEVQHQLERLAARELACLLPRQSGQREDRYMHLLGEQADLDALLAARQAEAPAQRGGDDSRIAELEARVAALEERLARLEG